MASDDGISASLTLPQTGNYIHVQLACLPSSRLTKRFRFQLVSQTMLLFLFHRINCRTVVFNVRISRRKMTVPRANNAVKRERHLFLTSRFIWHSFNFRNARRLRQPRIRITRSEIAGWPWLFRRIAMPTLLIVMRINCSEQRLFFFVNFTWITRLWICLFFHTTSNRWTMLF